MHNLRGAFRAISNIYDEAFSCLYFGRNAPYIWKGAKYGSATSIFNIFPLSLFGYLNEYTIILCFFWKCEAILLTWRKSKLLKDISLILKAFSSYGSWKYHFLYISIIQMQKSSLWKTSRWNAILIYTINKNNNKNKNKNQERITKAFETFLLNETILSIK